MAYAYTNTIPGLLGAIRQLRSAFPSPVTADTLKKWGIAPNNETYVIHVLRFLRAEIPKASLNRCVLH